MFQYITIDGVEYAVAATGGLRRRVTPRGKKPHWRVVRNESPEAAKVRRNVRKNGEVDEEPRT
jgi:hypothetical protein